MTLLSLLPYNHFLFSAAISAAVAALAAAFSLPSRALHGLHTYIHPDSLPAGSAAAPRAALRPPSADPRRRSKLPRSDFDESSAQLFRLRLVDSHLQTRLFFPNYRTAFLSSAFALPLLYLRSAAAAPAAVVAAAAAAIYILISLAKTSAEPSASKRSEKQLSLLSAFLGFLAAMLITLLLSPSVFDFKLGGSAAPTAAALAGCLAGLIFIPSTRAARSFWLGTDQLRWNLSVVSCGAVSRFVLYVAIESNLFAPLLWIKPLTAAVPEWSRAVEEYRIWVLLAAAVLQLLVLRPNLQMYLNEAVLCWYQRLHSSRAPDLDYGRAKVFLHNHYLCLALVQFLAPPVLVLLFLGLSQLRGNLFSGVPNLEDYSALVKEIALFMAWWIMFVRAVLTMVTLAIYRCGFLFVS